MEFYGCMSDSGTTCVHLTKHRFSGYKCKLLSSEEGVSDSKTAVATSMNFVVLKPLEFGCTLAKFASKQ